MPLHSTRDRMWSKVGASTKKQLAILHEHMKDSQELLSVAHKELENDPDLDALIESLFEDVKGSDMAGYWLDFMAMVDALMMNVHAIHTCS